MAGASSRAAVPAVLAIPSLAAGVMLGLTLRTLFAEPLLPGPAAECTPAKAASMASASNASQKTAPPGPRCTMERASRRFEELRRRLGDIEAAERGGQCRQLSRTIEGKRPYSNLWCPPEFLFGEDFGPLDAERLQYNTWRRRTAPYLKIVLTPGWTVGGMDFNGGADYFSYNMFFKERPDTGFYVEMGASNGVHASTTFLYDEFLGWNGLLIEPTPCGICNIPHNRPRAMTMQRAVCAQRQVLDMSKNGFCPVAQLAGCDNYETTVNCTGFGDMLKDAGVRHVDFLSLDVEEHEMDALRTFDWDGVSVSVMVVECWHPECIPFIESKGFLTLPISIDSFPSKPAMNPLKPGEPYDYLCWKPHLVSC